MVTLMLPVSDVAIRLKNTAQTNLQAPVDKPKPSLFCCVTVSSHRMRKNSALSSAWPALAAYLALTGCNTTPDRAADGLGIQVPAHWRAAASTESRTPSWLAAFNDPQLTAMVQNGLANNFKLKSAAARVDAAREPANPWSA